MEMKFHGLEFKLDDDKIFLTNLMDFARQKEGENYPLFKFIECQIAGENHPVHCGAKRLNCSESNRLFYASYSVKENKLEIITKSPKNITIISNFQAFDDCKVIRTWNSISNDSRENELIIENLSSLRFAGFGENGTESLEDIDVYVFRNSWHVECQVEKVNLKDSCFYNGNDQSMKRFLISNTGSWSTKEYLPQCIIEDKKNHKFLFLQIESSSSWSLEIGDEHKLLYLHAGGANMTDHQAAVKLDNAPSSPYLTKAVAFVVGDSLNEVLQEMTKYRRHIVKRSLKDRDLPVIFNEYMHLSWDSPQQERTEMIAEQLQDFGIKYYVIDCGWHDECEPRELYAKCGEWVESNLRFPKGIKATSTKLKTLGMKTGLWMEPEIIGINNPKMREYYGDRAFFKRNGKNVINASRLFLDFRHPKVISFLNNAVDRMINAYGATYLKLDYNQDTGCGTETDAINLGDGLLQSTAAYQAWIKSLNEKYPHVIFETCASGGCRMDYETLQSFSLTSTSDQTNFMKYPYIVSNILSAVLPEQAGVWSYPVDSLTKIDHEYNYHTHGLDAEGIKDYIENQISKEQIAMNMINTFLGRMHLASPIFLLSPEKQELIKEGIRYYNSLTPFKKVGVPYLPFGFSHFGDPHVASGFIAKKTLYLAVWNLNGNKEVVIPIKEYKLKNISLKYPTYSKANVTMSNNEVKVKFMNSLDSCFLEIGLED
ncbi:MAG: glycoside hydrolase family 36 protein [Bacilli bacterium]|jgi:alpha-galactosidase